MSVSAVEAQRADALAPVTDDFSAFIIAGAVSSDPGKFERATEGRTPAQGVEDGVEAERLGFRRVFISERWDIKEADVILAAIGAKTTRLELATGIIVPTTRQVWMPAALGATMQACFGPRFVLGLGRGDAGAFKGMGIPMTTYKALVESAQMTRRLWAGETIAYKGQLGEFDALALHETYHGEQPPIWIAGFCHELGAKAAAQAFDGVILPPMLVPEATAAAVQRIRNSCEQIGRDPSEIRIVQPVVTAPDMDEVETMSISAGRLVTYLTYKYYGDILATANGWDLDTVEKLRNHEQFTGLGNRAADLTFHRHEMLGPAAVLPWEWITDCSAIGTPEECARSLQRFLDAGADEVTTYGSTPAQNAALIQAWRERPELVMTTVTDARTFANAPAEYFGHSWHAMQHLPADELRELQLQALRLRFDELRDQIPTLQTLAEHSGISSIDTLDDAVPLLFQHTVYKSYPASLLLKNRFTELTKWLDRLTTHDLSSVDVSAAESIDEWLDVLDAETPLKVVHTSGTAGTMSFLPRSGDEWDQMYRCFRCGLFQFSDPTGAGGRHAGEYFNLIWPLYRHGRSAITRVPEFALPHLCGDESRLHTLRPGRMSSDAMYLAGRLRAAAARGELDQLEINPALAKRKEEFERAQKEMAESLPNFINEMVEKLRGQRIWLLATWNVLYGIAAAGIEAGLENVFAPDSLITTGGGAKGAVVPDDWEEKVHRFIGVDHVQHCYVMSEMTALNKLCEHGRYHFEPWVIPYVLDPEDGSPLSRHEGEQTGRAAIFDVLPNSYWGGFISGDEVTLSHDPCACGRTTSHLARAIERYSEKQSGDDKITCVAAEDAHRAALQFLTERLA